MSLLLNYKNVVSNKNGANIIYLVDEKFNISSLKKYISNSHYSFLTDLLKTSDIKSEILNFEINSKKTIILVSLKKNLSKSGAEKLGAKLYSYIKKTKTDNDLIYVAGDIGNAYETPYPDYFIRTNPDDLYAIPDVIDETIYHPFDYR